MALFALLALFAPPEPLARAHLRALHSYDVLSYEVDAEPRADGVVVRCVLRLKALRAGPVRMFFSPGARGLSVTRDGLPVAATLGTGRFEALLRFVVPVAGVAPTQLSLEPALRAGEEATFRLDYTWSPPRGGFAYADGDGVQTHLSGWWLPTMADELFEAVIRVKGPRPALATGEREGETDVFRTRDPVQVLALVTGPFGVRRAQRDGRTLEAWVPEGVRVDADALLEDLGVALATLESWWGRGAPDRFALVVEPRSGNGPSYCAGSFVVIDRAVAESKSRPARVHVLAHECAHLWWGHRVPTTIVGDGGTWLREGLAEWSAIEATGAILGDAARDALWRATLKAYLKGIDLRGEGALVVHESALVDATYLDPPRIAYERGALVLRAIAHARGAERFREGLRAFAAERAFRFSGVADFVRATGAEPWIVEYYAGFPRLPDLALRDVLAEPGRLSARIVCADGAWKGGTVPCVVRTDRGEHRVSVDVKEGLGSLAWQGEGTPREVELDPERLWLDPIRANSLWRSTP